MEEDMDMLHTEGKKTPVEQLKEHKEDLSEKQIVDLHKITEMKQHPIDLTTFDERTRALDGDIRSNWNNLGLAGYRRAELIKQIDRLCKEQRVKDGFIRNIVPKDLYDLQNELIRHDDQTIPEYITLLEKTKIEYEGCKKMVNEASIIQGNSHAMGQIEKMHKNLIESIGKILAVDKEIANKKLESDISLMDKVVDSERKLTDDKLKNIIDKIEYLEKVVRRNSGHESEPVPKSATVPEPDTINYKQKLTQVEFDKLKEQLVQKEEQLSEMTQAPPQPQKPTELAGTGFNDAKAQEPALLPDEKKELDKVRNHKAEQEELKKKKAEKGMMKDFEF